MIGMYLSFAGSRLPSARALVRLTVRFAVCSQLAVSVAAAQPTDRLSNSEGFLAVDLFGGTHPEVSTSTQPNPPSATYGWEVGSTVRFARRFGIYGAVGRVRTPERAWITHVMVGPRVSSPLGRVTDLRGFAHVLVGRASSELAAGATADSGEVVMGGGLDAFNVFRVQLDYVRRNLPAFPKNNGRFLFGVAIPFCFRGCQPGDGFAISGRSDDYERW